ncbi:type II/IV secretion system ATPase subunit [Candidatus Woesearchaeota archaeon]|nr:type II/IV secretion system ATPase subunit [Candidatus Woesearchaeota archaeon]
MVRRKKPPVTKDFERAQAGFPHLRNYLRQVTAELGEPEWHEKLERSMKKIQYPNIIYPVGDPIFIHIYKKPGEHMMYHVIEPQMDEETKKLNDSVLDKMIEIAHRLPVPDKIEDATPVLKQLFGEVTVISESRQAGLLEKWFAAKIPLTKVQAGIIEYYLLRNRVGYGKLEPLFNDPYLEDIHCVGVGAISTIHKIFDMVHTNITFPDDLDLNKYMLETSERVERPVSDAHSVVDAIMPDGSRVNFIYGREVSLEGSSFTVRKFSEVPVSITQIIDWGTMSAELAAYIWMCLEHGMNMFVCGETASGKTTTLNATATFIKPDDKVYSVENTPEVTMPHDTWQHLVTREAGKETDVTMFDLLLAALRSRPNYIIVGEIRGQEGNVAFQAMQTGHPVCSTFHAGSVHTMIQRLTGEPINVPIAFIDNLNIVLIQQAVYRDGHFVRRVLSITEIERYYDIENKVITRQVFAWDPIEDKHRFRGLYNSYILEKKIAQILGYEDTRDIYDELALRKRVLERMVELKIFNYFDVWEVIKKFHIEGVKGLPFTV